MSIKWKKNPRSGGCGSPDHLPSITNMPSRADRGAADFIHVFQNPASAHAEPKGTHGSWKRPHLVKRQVVSAATLRPHRQRHHKGNTDALRFRSRQRRERSSLPRVVLDFGSALTSSTCQVVNYTIKARRSFRKVINSQGTRLFNFHFKLETRNHLSWL